MRSLTSSFVCRQPRQAKPLADRELKAWARSVVSDPQRHLATVRESAVVASLLAELEAQR
jgi:hypothetical protein